MVAKGAAGMGTARALAAHRGARVVELAAQGWSYDRIAQEVGYRSKGSVSKALWRTLDAHQAESVQQLRALEVMRLDFLQQRIWEQARAGDLRAVREIRKIIQARVRLLGLDKPDVIAREPVALVDQSFWDMIRETYGGNLDNWYREMGGGRYAPSAQIDPGDDAAPAED
jgi:hypothetical protein